MFASSDSPPNLEETDQSVYFYTSCSSSRLYATGITWAKTSCRLTCKASGNATTCHLRKAKPDLFLPLYHRDIDPWLIPLNSSPGAVQIAPTYNADYQSIITTTLFWEFEEIRNALKSNANKPPELVSQAQAQGAKRKYNHLHHRITQDDPLVHSSCISAQKPQPQRASIWEGRAFVFWLKAKNGRTPAC